MPSRRKCQRTGSLVTLLAATQIPVVGCPGSPGHVQPALPMLLDDGYTRVINATAALADGSLEIWRGAFTRDAG